MADLGLYEAVWSSWIIAELNRVLTIRWLKANSCDLSNGAVRALSEAAKKAHLGPEEGPNALDMP